MVGRPQSFIDILHSNNTSSNVLPLTFTYVESIITQHYFTFAGNLSCLEERARLSANLLRLILTQIDGKEDCGLGEKTVLPWVLLYHLIKHDEKSMNEFEDDVPCSVNFLCSAHDYLGPLSLCTLESGKVLTLLVDGM